MLKTVQKKLKNQKGFTLIELLAVIVILGIIAAIAIPSVLNIIDNSKKDSFIADAQQLVNSAKTAVSDNNIIPSTTPTYLTLNYLESKQYLDLNKDPDGVAFTLDSQTAPSTTEPSSTVSYVEVYLDSNNKIAYKVQLIGGQREISAQDPTLLSRSSVTAKPAS